MHGGFCSALLCVAIVIFRVALAVACLSKKQKKMQFLFIVCQKLFGTKLELHKLYLDELKWHIRIHLNYVNAAEIKKNKNKNINAAKVC